MRFAVAILACMGCKQLVGIEEGTVVDGGSNGSDGSSLDTPGGAECYGMDPYRICLPDGDNVDERPETPIDTSAPCRFTDTSNGRSWCVFVQDDIDLEELVASGAKPLVLLARHTITLPADVTIDASSHRGGLVGPGANPSDCVVVDGTVSSGGAGGSFGTRGGSGGNSGPMASSVLTTTRFAGGCAGGTGPQISPGGAGGGAIYLVAGDEIVIQGTINASGAGGTGGSAGGGGGGGGGSGGMIILSAPILTISNGASVFANGGGGGQGGGLTEGEAGETATQLDKGGKGGSGGIGGIGGEGARASQDGRSGGTDTFNGGGGGGGGVGKIIVLGQSVSTAPGTFSPPPSP